MKPYKGLYLPRPNDVGTGLHGAVAFLQTAHGKVLYWHLFNESIHSIVTVA